MIRVFPIVIALLLALAGCSKSEPVQARPNGPVQVHALTVQPERVERIVELTGRLGGAEEVTVSAEVDGRVEKVLADLGDKVALGAPLVQIDASELRLREAQADSDYLQSLAKLGVEAARLDRFEPEAQADVRRAEADLAEARRNLERGEELMKRGLLAEGELDTLRTRERVATASQQKALEDARSSFALAKGRRASLGLARKKRLDSTITSPVAGSVAKRMVALGEYVKAGQAVAVVVVTDPLKLHGEAPDRYAGQLHRGMPVDVELDVAGLGAHTGEVARVGPLVSATSHTFPVEALFQNADGTLKPGLFARAKIRVGADEEVFAVPETAISSVAGVTKVFVIEDAKARSRAITVLRKRDGDALLQGELKAGDRVVLTGIARMYEGAEVQVMDAPAEAAAPRSGN
ncbi:efflux RND transporter periplasmic adaptor subunit [Vulgatibacter incomptus]|uniref:RND efflux system, membrane fusion protein CmeA n=1 Tax=Vulgatibacter incomptus TaxID=1391653 RepID=A0A0K1P9S7_9BACT|nr:efflux RND transporter periplasmic adaptor subunit [Vulgatibacter incomptus]AKU90283.1 RND efflux system, membrane fusion protein CmeA [Vulgatibacter incomptus]